MYIVPYYARKVVTQPCGSIAPFKIGAATQRSSVAVVDVFVFCHSARFTDTTLHCTGRSCWRCSLHASNKKSPTPALSMRLFIRF